MLIGNGIYYLPRSGILPGGSSAVGSCLAVRPFHSAISSRRTFNTDYLSFPSGTFQSAITLPMKYGGVGMVLTSPGTVTGSMAAGAEVASTILGAGTVPTALLTGLKNRPCTMQGTCTFTGATKARARSTMTVSIGAQPSAFDIAQAVWGMDNGIETGWTPRQIMRVMAAVLAGKVSGAGANAPVFQAITDAKSRVEATTDASGNRINVNLDPS